MQISASNSSLPTNWGKRLNLDGMQKVEREKLERLLESMESRAHDLPSLMKVLSACEDINGLNPIPHIKAAIRHYLKKNE